MVKKKIHIEPNESKVDNLPANGFPNWIYYVRNQYHANRVDLFITDKNGNYKQVGNTQMINDLIDKAMENIEVGEGIQVTDLTLPVNVNGQVQFNIFQMPAEGRKHNLIVNHVLYFENESYTLGMNGSNTVLNWLNEFQITTSDKLIFRVF